MATSSPTPREPGTRSGDPVLPLGMLAGGYRRLEAAYAGTFPPGAVRAVPDDSYGTPAATATVRPHPALPAERFAAERLDALAHTAQTRSGVRGARMLFVCTANSGRSRLAAALFKRHARGTGLATSAGTAPAAEIDDAVAVALAEIGLAPEDACPKPVTNEVVAAADLVVTLGCADAPPLPEGRRYADWPVADPGGGLTDTVRAIRDDIDSRVRALPAELGPSATA